MEISIFDSYCLHVHNLSFHLNNSQFSSLVYSIGWKCYLLFCWMIGLHIDIKKVCFRFNTKNFMQECFCIHAITKRRVDCISRHVWAMCITKSTWMVLCMCVCWFSRWILYCVMNRFRSLEQLHVEIQEHYDPMHIYNCNDKRYRATRIQKLYGLKKNYLRKSTSPTQLHFKWWFVIFRVNGIPHTNLYWIHTSIPAEKMVNVWKMKCERDVQLNYFFF